jgi:hypothetical protein
LQALACSVVAGGPIGRQTGLYLRSPARTKVRCAHTTLFVGGMSIGSVDADLAANPFVRFAASVLLSPFTPLV